ncbi:MAG TPA: hypothetical protein VGF67_04140, partial [Ktedonobacteraceae bacterium]
GLCVFVTLAAALGVLGARCVARREYRWALYVLGSGLALLVLFFAGFTNAELVARTLRLATCLGWLAASLVAVKLLREQGQSAGRPGAGGLAHTLPTQWGPYRRDPASCLVFSLLTSSCSPGLTLF